MATPSNYFYNSAKLSGRKTYPRRPPCSMKHFVIDADHVHASKVQVLYLGFGKLNPGYPGLLGLEQ